MSTKNSRRRKQRALVVRTTETEEETKALAALGRALIPLSEKKNLITREEMKFIIDRYGAKNTVACAKFAEQICSIRWAAKQAGKTVMPPIWLPIVKAEDIDLRSCVIGITQLPFKRPELLPIPAHKLRQELLRYNQFFEAVLLSLPVLPLPVFTPKLLLLCTGLTWTVTTNSFDLFRYYMALAHLLSGTGDVVTKEAAAAAEEELRQNQLAVYEELSSRFDLELKERLSGPTVSAEALRSLELWAFDFTHNYILCYERYILQFTASENQAPLPDRSVESLDDLMAVDGSEDANAEKKRRIVAQGIPAEHSAEFFSRGKHPDVEMHCSESLMQDVRKTALSVASAREKVSPLVVPQPEESTLAPRYLPFDLLARLAAFVRKDESVKDDLLRFAQEQERKNVLKIQQAGLPLDPPPLEPAPSAEEEAAELTARFRVLSASETADAVAESTAASMQAGAGAATGDGFEKVLCIAPSKK